MKKNLNNIYFSTPLKLESIAIDKNIASLYYLICK